MFPTTASLCVEVKPHPLPLFVVEFSCRSLRVPLADSSGADTGNTVLHWARVEHESGRVAMAYFDGEQDLAHFLEGMANGEWGDEMVGARLVCPTHIIPGSHFGA